MSYAGTIALEVLLCEDGLRVGVLVAEVMRKVDIREIHGVYGYFGLQALAIILCVGRFDLASHTWDFDPDGRTCTCGRHGGTESTGNKDEFVAYRPLASSWTSCTL